VKPENPKARSPREERLLARLFHTCAEPFINTVALARWKDVLWTGQPRKLSGFITLRKKPLKRLTGPSALSHRAKAAVLIKGRFGHGEVPESADICCASDRCLLGIRRSATTAFTLIELLVVIAIIGLLAALAAPVLHNFRPNYTASVTQQLLTDLARARQLAISQHTTVYMVFVPTNFFGDPVYVGNYGKMTAADLSQATNLFDKQAIGYNFVSLHSMGDQPGRPSVHYLSSWKSLPEGGFIYPAKFQPYFPNSPVMNIYTNVNQLAFRVFGFNRTNGIPFPMENTARYSFANPFPTLPYIAFDYMGRLASGRDEVIPITRGSVLAAHDPNRRPRMALPAFNEQPVGNTTNGYNVVYVDWLTGRARSLQQTVQ
jgi:prepilin-type N-terminal cleavage/methylation domain-containing protein